MTITPGNYNLTIYPGYSVNQTFTWLDQNGNPVNLTSYGALLEARYNLTDTSAFITLSTGAGSIVLGGSAGTITLIMSTAQTATLIPGIGVYNLQITTASGEVDPLLQGQIIIQELPTR